MGHEIVVGYDGTDASRSGLAWAVRDARLRDLDLVVCHAWNQPYAAADPDQLRAAESFARSTLDEGVFLANQALPGRRVGAELGFGPAAHVLSRRSRHAASLVVGSRGPGPPDRRRASAISNRVAVHAACPVVVVREVDVLQPGEKDSVVAVAVDDSGTSDRALEFAFGQAVATGTDLYAACGRWADGADRRRPCTAADARAEQIWFTELIPTWQSKYPRVGVKAEFVHGRSLPEVLSRIANLEIIVVGISSGVDAPAMLTDGMRGHPECPVAVVKT